MAIFVTEQANSAGDETSHETTNKPKESWAAEGACSTENNVITKEEKRDEYFMANWKRPQVVWDEEELRWKKKMTAEEMAIRRRRVVATLNRRRNAVCKEIERDWFLEGASLEKHRHNLQVTHELAARGLAVWW